MARWLHRTAPAERVGTMHELGGNVVALVDHPKVIDHTIGALLA